ncbi:hypothetical protein LJC26_06380 [Desulfovibrio sp. OttesenSCG-928-O18]|nr:hypothetical protein [Desulfovibrio sp. OttesenSCG-928-O18]
MESQETRTTSTPAAAPMQAAPSRVSVGSVLGRSLETLLKNPVVFFGLTLAVMLPLSIIASLLPSEFAMVITVIFSAILGFVIQGAVAYGVFQTLRGNTAGIGDALGRGFVRFIPILIASILIGLGVGIGMMLLIVPGVMLMCIWAVTIPVCAVEKKGAIDSMKRSAELTKGYRWTIFGLFLITGIITGVLSTLLSVLLLPILSGSLLVFTIIQSIIVAIPQTFQYVMTATIYYDLRAEKEGVSIDSLANVFD